MSLFKQHNTRAAKVTPGIVQDIRTKYASGGWSQGALAREYGLSVIQIGRIVRYESWVDVPDAPTVEGLEAMAARLAAEARPASTRMSEELERATRTDRAAEEVVRDLSPPAAERLKTLKGESNAPQLRTDELAPQDPGSDPKSPPDPGYA